MPFLWQPFTNDADFALSGSETEESEEDLAPCPVSSHVCLAAAIEVRPDRIHRVHGAGDAEFAPSGSEAEDESEEEGSSEQESLASEGGSDEEAPGSEDEDEESGMDWDELEKEAERCGLDLWCCWLGRVLRQSGVGWEVLRVEQWVCMPRRIHTLYIHMS